MTRTALLCALLCAPAVHAQQPAWSWDHYGGDAGGSRYSPLTAIDRANVAGLEIAWSYRTGELGQNARDGHELTFEATPILFEGTLYLSTAFGKVVALDPATGRERWARDLGVDRTESYSEVTSRGVSAWRDPAASGHAPCAARIVLGTIDARLVALDARTGEPCARFGKNGAVDLAADLAVESGGDYQVTSPPAILDGVIVVGTSIGDLWSADTGPGTVRGFDARTGARLWTWDPIQRVAGRVGAANAWPPISADSALGLVYLVTGSPSPDFFGGMRPGDNADASSVVALRAATGEKVWTFQTVHHDLWDFDLAAQPALVDLRVDGRTVPALVQATKIGTLFVLDRRTGEPLWPVEERPVPASDVPGEAAWPTQPFPTRPAPLLDHAPLTGADAWGPTDAIRQECAAMIAGARSEGVFTPPSLGGSILWPGNAGGTNWGSVAFDPTRQYVVLNWNRLPTFVALVPQDSLHADMERTRVAGADMDYGRQRGAPYAVKRRMLLSTAGTPCIAPPWGEIGAVDLATGDVAWRTPLGYAPGQPADSPPLGMINMGGPMVTAGGLVFIAATPDNRFRALDVETGRELWSAALPAAGVATPMTYEADGRQFVVIAAGGHGKAGFEIGDYVVAFALPR